MPTGKLKLAVEAVESQTGGGARALPERERWALTWHPFHGQLFEFDRLHDAHGDDPPREVPPPGMPLSSLGAMTRATLLRTSKLV